MKCPKCQFENPSDSKFCKECGTRVISSEEIPISHTKTLETSREEFTRGTTFAGRYEIIEELGKGGMGKVYRVEDKKIKEEVALKLIKPEIASDKKTIERFSNELRMARKISHRNVCRMYDLGEEKGIHYITMEYVPGEDLKGSIRRMGPLTAGKTLFIAKQVCEGLAEAHRFGVVHRDLKPQNIMVDEDGNARIMDFGISRTIKGKGITVTFGVKKLLIPALAVIALAVIAVALLLLFPREKVVLIPSGKPSLAVMYFKNNTGVDRLDIWRSALSDLMIADLAQSRYITVMSGDKLFEILKELNLLDARSYASGDLKEVAALGGATHILQGILTKSGDSFRINTTLQDASIMKIIDSEMVEGIGEESFHGMVDELTRKVKTNFKLSEEEIAGDIDRDVGKITTSSPEAYKYYSEGRKYHLNADYMRSIKLMEQAIVIDSEFAMAYRSMGMSYRNRGRLAERKKYLQKAVELSDRLSERERNIIQGGFYRTSERTYDKAIEAYEKLLELYPDDKFGNDNLGSLYLDIEEWDKAIERYQVCLKSKEKTLFNYTGLASAYRGKALYDESKEVLESYIRTVSDNASIRRDLAGVYIQQGKLDLAFEEAGKAFLLDPAHYVNFLIKGDIYLYKGDLNQAEKEYQKSLEHELVEAQAYGLQRLGWLYFTQGKFKKAEIMLRLGIEKAQKVGEAWAASGFYIMLAHDYRSSRNYQKSLEAAEESWKAAVAADFRLFQLRSLYHKGLTYFEMKSLDEALKTAERIKGMVEKGMYKKHIRYYHFLTGLIELERQQFSTAIEKFQKTLFLQSYGPLVKGARYIDYLALAYYRSGDLEKAREEYERIAALTQGRLDLGDIYAKSFYNLGKIFEKKGDKTQAIKNYEKFLALWKNADPGIPEVEDARKRLAELQSQ